MSYVGEYKDGLRDGVGSYVFPSGSFSYKGEWKRGKMHGNGVFAFCGSGSYEGEFVDGEIQGIGLRRWPDGSTYNGQFHRGVRQGEGVHIAASGETYEGHWLNNQRQGLGELRYSNNDIYRGDFSDHYPHGNGRIKFALDGSTYDGDWVRGQRCGRGLLKASDGRRLYDGEWLNGKRHGHGGGYVNQHNGSASTIMFEGVWADDAPLAPTSKLAFKVVVQSPTNEDDSVQNPLHYEDVPPQIIVEKKQGSRLPALAVVSVHVLPHTQVHSIVTGESGRQLRLRIFEGSVPSKDTPADGENLVPIAQWKFALPVATPSEFISEKTSEDPATNVENESVDVEEKSVEELFTTNSSGIALFDSLILPSTSLVGNYHLVCDTIGDVDGIEAVAIPLQLIE